MAKAFHSSYCLTTNIIPILLPAYFSISRDYHLSVSRSDQSDTRLYSRLLSTLREDSRFSHYRTTPQSNTIQLLFPATNKATRTKCLETRKPRPPYVSTIASLLFIESRRAQEAHSIYPRRRHAPCYLMTKENQSPATDETGELR